MRTGETMNTRSKPRKPPARKDFSSCFVSKVSKTSTGAISAAGATPGTQSKEATKTADDGESSAPQYREKSTRTSGAKSESAAKAPSSISGSIQNKSSNSPTARTRT